MYIINSIEIFFFQAKNQQQNAVIPEDVAKGLEGKLSPLQALFSPPGLQQMQQFLQQVANNGGGGGQGAQPPSFNPAQLHHLMQQQQTFLSHHQVSGFYFCENWHLKLHNFASGSQFPFGNCYDLK